MHIDREDMLALTRRMTVKRTSMTRIAGGYMDSDGCIDGTFNIAFLKLSPADREKNLQIAKKVPFAETNQNLQEYKFLQENMQNDSLWKLLMGMRACGLKNDALMETFYEIVGANYKSKGDYAVYVFHDRYDIPVVEDAAEGFGSKFDGRILGTFGKFGVLSFNGNKMITTSGGGALVCQSVEDKNTVMWYATQARDAYPYYQHTAIGYNYRMSNICAGIGRGQMTVVQEHIDHHKHVQALYEELLKEVRGVHIHRQPADSCYDSNYWLCTATLDANVRVQGQENAYKEVIKTAVGGAAGVIKAVESATTDCQPNDNVEALRVFMAANRIETRPVWKPMHKQPVYADAVVYTNGVEEEIFKVGFCLPAGPWVTDEDVKYIVEKIKEAIL